MIGSQNISNYRIWIVKCMILITMTSASQLPWERYQGEISKFARNWQSLWPKYRLNLLFPDKKTLVKKFFNEWVGELRPNYCRNHGTHMRRWIWILGPWTWCKCWCMQRTTCQRLWSHRIWSQWWQMREIWNLTWWQR